MKKHITLLGLVVPFLFSISCDENSSPKEEVPITKNNKVSESILAVEPSVYGDFLISNAPMLGFSTSKENSLANDVFTPVIGNESSLKSSGKDLHFTANGEDLVLQSKHLKSNQINHSNIISALYGQDVMFKIGSGSALKSNSSTADSVEMYIPELVQITSPSITSEEQLYPYCYFDNMTIKWNADNDNCNGLVVIVEWNGTVLDNNSDEDMYVRNIDIIKEDNGSCTLKNELFANIPHKGLAYITLLRGNLEIIDIDGEQYRVFGETHTVLPFILVRELN